MKTFNKTRERLTGEDVKDSSMLFFRHMAVYLFCLEYVKDKKVLELGCGDGYGSFILAKKAKTIIATDIDKKTISEAQKKYKLRGLKFACLDALSLPYEDEFDVVISFQVIEHVKDVRLYLSNIKKVLKKNGVFILSTPNRLLRLYKGQKPWNRFHIEEYEESKLKNMLEKHFPAVEMLGVHAAPVIYKAEKKRLYLRRLIARIDLFNMYEKLPRGIADSFLGVIKRFVSKKGKITANSDDFWISKDKLNNSLDIVGICKK